MATIFSNEAEILRIGEGLFARTLPRAEWTHAAHFAVTLWLMRHRPDLALEAEMPGLIRAFNEATGTPNTDTGGYHETITLASLRAARMWLAERPHLSLHVVLAELMASPFGRSDWLLSYWTRPVLFSVAARRGWIGPDVKPLPF